MSKSIYRSGLDLAAASCMMLAAVTGCASGSESANVTPDERALDTATPIPTTQRPATGFQPTTPEEAIVQQRVGRLTRDAQWIVSSEQLRPARTERNFRDAARYFEDQAEDFQRSMQRAQRWFEWDFGRPERSPTYLENAEDLFWANPSRIPRNGVRLFF